MSVGVSFFLEHPQPGQPNTVLVNKVFNSSFAERMLLHVLPLIHAFRDARAPLTIDMTPSLIHGLSHYDWETALTKAKAHLKGSNDAVADRLEAADSLLSGFDYDCLAAYRSLIQKGSLRLVPAPDRGIDLNGLSSAPDLFEYHLKHLVSMIEERFAIKSTEIALHNGGYSPFFNGAIAELGIQIVYVHLNAFKGAQCNIRTDGSALLLDPLRGTAFSALTTIRDWCSRWRIQFDHQLNTSASALIRQSQTGLPEAALPNTEGLVDFYDPQLGKESAEAAADSFVTRLGKRLTVGASDPEATISLLIENQTDLWFEELYFIRRFLAFTATRGVNTNYLHKLLNRQGERHAGWLGCALTSVPNPNYTGWLHRRLWQFYGYLKSSAGVGREETEIRETLARIVFRGEALLYDAELRAQRENSGSLNELLDSIEANLANGTGLDFEDSELRSLRDFVPQYSFLSSRDAD